LRFKADESAQAITGAYRQAHPEDNNERQLVHEHVSVPLDGEKTKKAAAVHKEGARRAVAMRTGAGGVNTSTETKPGGGSR
jgi:hypothetical protein